MVKPTGSFEKEGLRRSVRFAAKYKYVMSFMNIPKISTTGDFEEIRQLALTAQTIANSNQTLIATKATQSNVTTSLSLKQDVISDGDLQISHVSNLQSSLDLKADLQTMTNVLSTKQPTIVDNSLSISRTTRYSKQHSTLKIRKVL